MNRISSLLVNWGLFCRPDLKILIVAPPKCGSTSIFTYLACLGLDENIDLSPYDSSCEFTPELRIHQYVRKCLPSESELISYFADREFLKILIVRDPLQRLLSAIISKYLVPGSSFANEIGAFHGSTPSHYSSPQEFTESVNEIARLLILKGLAHESFGSHVAPITSTYDGFVRSNFDKVVDISSGANGFSNLRSLLEAHMNVIGGKSSKYTLFK